MDVPFKQHIQEHLKVLQGLEAGADPALHCACHCALRQARCWATFPARCPRASPGQASPLSSKGKVGTEPAASQERD